ncbi:MAG: hypothetical protein JKX75_04695 [Gammaproteobacteria bacterium]|nr:hypothetical protein [Gammaproteobacteria bacterium]
MMNKSIKLHIVRTLMLFIMLAPVALQAASIPPISGRSIDVMTLLPGDVLARANLVLAELDLIRAELGKSEKNYERIEVFNAAPREVYYQALALFKKSNRLAFEHTGFSEKNQRELDAKTIRPYHVWNMVDKALQRVLVVKQKLNIPERSKEVRTSDETRPDQVFSAVNYANRQINYLLHKRFSPSDVFQQVTIATNVMAQLLATFDGVERIPEQDEMVRRKTPTDVYSRLNNCFEVLREITLLSGGQILEFTKHDNRVRIPSDVYDLTSLLVADIEYLHAQKKSVGIAADVYYPGDKIPSHVYQRASILEKQLKLLLDKVKKQPSWLKS